MPKCFLTGVEVSFEDAFLLDSSAARHLLKDLKERIASLERMIEQLGAVDKVELPNPSSGQKRVRKDRRLVSQSVAEVLQSGFPEKCLFLTWRSWRSRLSDWQAAGKPRIQVEVKRLEPTPTTGDPPNLPIA